LTRHEKPEAGGSRGPPKKEEAPTQKRRSQEKEGRRNAKRKEKILSPFLKNKVLKKFRGEKGRAKLVEKRSCLKE